MRSWDKEKVKEVYSKLCLEHGDKSITSNTIRKEGYTNLPSMIIRYFGSKEVLDKELGYNPFLTTWDIKRTFETYKELCEKHGGPVMLKTIREEGHATLPNKIIEYYGSKETLDDILGYTTKRISWTKEKTKEIYSKLCEEKNGPASYNDMKSAGYATLQMKINEYWGLKQHLDIELGYVPKKKTWKKEEVKEIYHNLCLQNGDKSVSQKKCNEVSGLVSSILKHYGSKIDLDIELGYTPMRVNWSRELVIEEYKKLCEANGGKSTNAKTNDVDGDLTRQILKYFGTKESLDVELGYKPLRLSWSRERVIEDYTNLCKANGDKPFSFSERADENTALLHAIRNHFGSKLTLDELLGYKPLRTNWTKEMIKEKYHELCLANGDKPIPGDVLVAMGHNDLTTAMGRRYKKRDLDNDLGYETSTLWDVDLVKKTYKELCEKHGNRTLSQIELVLLGFGKLITAINKYCGSKSELDFELGFIPYKLFLLPNGVIVRSTYEVMFGNFLIKNKIKFKTDKVICKDCPERYRYDFLIKDIDGNDLYFEIWGGESKTKHKKFKNYSKVRIVKTEFYKKLKLSLVDIESELFKNKSHIQIFDSIKELLIENKVKLNNFVELTADELIESLNDRLWDKEKTKNEYHRLCINNGDKGLKTSELTKMNRSDLIHAIRDYWVNKRNLDEYLGYEHTTTNWTKELIFEKALEMGRKHNLEFLSSDFIRKNLPGMDGAIYKLFNSREEFHQEYKKQFKN